MYAFQMPRKSAEKVGHLQGGGLGSKPIQQLSVSARVCALALRQHY